MSKAVTHEKLAIDGGTRVRTEPLPWEQPGSHYIGAEEADLLAQVVRAKSPYRHHGLDPQHMVDQLEQTFRDVFRRKHALGVGSATAGLHIALGALDIGPGDEVLLPGYLWCSCISAIIRLGAIPRLVDIDETFCMDPVDLKHKITPRSKAVLLVHMSGAPGHAERIVELARTAGLAVVEDCAESLGASCHGRLTGTFGDIAVFSFQPSRNITCGEGGMIVCDDDHLYKRCFALHDLGYARNNDGRLDPTDERYQLWGIGSRMSELAGAMALAQFAKLDQITLAMRKAKWAIRKQIETITGLGFRNILDPMGDSGPFLITIYRSPDICRRFTAAIQAEGIRGPEGSKACIPMQRWGLHWYFNNLSLVNRRGLTSDRWPWTHPVNGFADNYSYAKGTLPVCDDLADRAALLTIASCLSQQDINDIVAAFHKVARAGLLA